MAIDETVSEHRNVLLFFHGGGNQIKSKFRTQGKVRPLDQGPTFSNTCIHRTVVFKVQTISQIKIKKQQQQHAKLVG